MIVKELNAALNRNYDLIKFDSLDEKQLLQLLVDLLVSLNAGEKVIYESISLLALNVGIVLYTPYYCVV